jgi:hypothetical protein
MARFSDDPPDPLFAEYAEAIGAATTDTAVRQVLKRALTDKRMVHRLYHALGVTARLRVSEIRDQESGIRDQPLPVLIPDPKKTKRSGIRDHSPGLDT